MLLPAAAAEAVRGVAEPSGGATAAAAAGAATVPARSAAKPGGGGIVAAGGVPAGPVDDESLTKATRPRAKSVTKSPRWWVSPQK